MSGKFLIMPHHQIQLTVRVQKSKSMKRNLKFQIKLWKVIIMSSVASCSKDFKKSILHRYFDVICLNIPTEAVMLSDCHHLLCEGCLQLWLECNGVSPTCCQCVESEEDIMPLSQHMLAVFDLLTICCTYSENGCTQKLKINQIHHHEETCKFRKGK